MFCVQSSTARVATRNYASASDIVACFHAERSVLAKLAFLITADQASADQAFAEAYESALHRSSPFRDWVVEWAKTATIATAVLQQREAIRVCEGAHRTRRCTHIEHLWQGDAKDRAATLHFILEGGTPKITGELDPLCRAVLLLRVAIRSSIQDCALRLNVCRAAVLGANCYVMTWLQVQHVLSP